MTIGKREAKILIPAVIYGWAIEKPFYRKTAYWEDDPTMPLAIGPVVEKLIRNGFLERNTFGNVTKIVATPKSRSLLCRQPGCYRGKLIDDYGNETTSCPRCFNGLELSS